MVIDRSVSTSTRSARSRLSDVLAHIRSGKIEEEYEYDDGDEGDPDFASPPIKRRNTLATTTSRHYLTTAADRRSRGEADHSHVLNSTHASNRSVIGTPAAGDTSLASQQPRTSGFILKLFDRTVDLAQFSHVDANEDAPLYPVCRAWVHSQNPAHSLRRARLGPEAHESPDTNAEDMAEAIHQLPKPVERECIVSVDATGGDSGGPEVPLTKTKIEIDSRIPACVRHWKPADDVFKSVDRALTGRQEEWTVNCLLEANRKSWKQCRDEWKRAAQANESRYHKSARILKDMYLANTARQL